MQSSWLVVVIIHSDGVFYMANSGVVEKHRQQGIYSSLVRAVIEQSAILGPFVVRSLRIPAIVTADSGRS